MDQDAKATGGLAFFSDNALEQIASRIVSDDSSYYTLTYAPQDLKRDGKWHKVKVTLNDPHYHLSYRRGYFDDGQTNPQPTGKMHTRLQADGKTIKLPSDPGEPIVFQATVLPAANTQAAAPTAPSGIMPKPLKKGQTAYTIHYTIPASAIQPHNIEGNIGTDQVRSGIIAFNRFGKQVTSVLEAAVFKVTEDTVRSDPNAVLGFDQQINLPDGEDDLYIVVWDTTTGRFGTVSVSLDVAKPRKAKS